jgi:putative membrane protein
MESALGTLTALGWGTLVLRPYVFAFLAFFLVAGGRDLGLGRALGFVAWGFAVAFTAEWASTRVGVPFGLYHYTGQTRGAELYLSNVPFFDSLSFPFLGYAAFCLARWALPGAGGVSLVGLAGILMMLLDVVIDPLAVRGDRWFLGRIFYYPHGGLYFGVPLSNFAGWVLVGWLIVGGYVAATRGRISAPGARAGGPGLGVALYGGVLVFNLAITAWIGERALLIAGTLLHFGAFLLLYCVRVARRRGGRAPVAPGAQPSAGRARQLRAEEG